MRSVFGLSFAVSRYREEGRGAGEIPLLTTATTDRPVAQTR